MPRWDATTMADGTVRHELAGAIAGARVHAMPDEGSTVVYIALALDGADEATVERGKRRAEELYAAAIRGLADTGRVRRGLSPSNLGSNDG